MSMPPAPGEWGGATPPQPPLAAPPSPATPEGAVTKAKVLVVDDDLGILHLLKLRLEAANYAVTVAETGKDAVTAATEETFDLAIIDLYIEEENGIAVLGRLLQTQPAMLAMIATGRSTVDTAVEAIKAGAYDYLEKPFDMANLFHRLEKALEVRRLKGELERLRTLVHERYQFSNIVAASAKMQQILHQVAQIAGTESTVCIYGESGTGKELVAKAVHVASRRGLGPFVPINCGAIPEGLLENELFGHTKGAYTGADRPKRGLLQQAEGGTLFLDEIGELPLPLQVKLLRVLQEREFYALGSNQPTKVNFRLVAATNQDLEALVAKGKFREDLFYRVHVLPVVLPPLRERPDDIVPLAQHFLQRFAQELDKPVQGFTPEALQRLVWYEWPGNVRELANVVERAMVLGQTNLVTPDLLLLGKSEVLRPHHSELTTMREAREKFERDYLVQVLTMVKGHVSRAAELAGKDRAEFYRLLRKHALVPRAFKGERGVDA